VSAPIPASSVVLDQSFLHAEIERINAEIGRPWEATEAVRYVRLNTDRGYDAAGVAAFGSRLVAIYKAAGWSVGLQYQVDRNVRQLVFSRPEPLLEAPFSEVSK